MIGTTGLEDASFENLAKAYFGTCQQMAALQWMGRQLDKRQERLHKAMAQIETELNRRHTEGTMIESQEIKQVIRQAEIAVVTAEGAKGDTQNDEHVIE